MHTPRTRRLARPALLAFLAMVVTAMPNAPTVAPAHAAQSDVEVPDPDVERGMDRIVLRNTNKVVSGRILEVTDARVHMEVIVAGISAERTFKRSNIAAIEFGDPVSGDAVASADIDEADRRDAPKKIYDDTARIYMVELGGTFGVHISQTPLLEVFEDVDETFDDLVVDSTTGDLVVDPAVRDRHVVVFKLDNTSNAQDVFQAVSRAEDMYPIIERNRIEKGRRVIFWVEQARGGGVFLALSSPEIYFSSGNSMQLDETPRMMFDERLDLEEFDSGDDMVDEKLISARLGHAIGAVNVGGYDDADLLVRAMVRSSNWLSVRYEGGEAILTDRAPPEGSWVSEDKTVWTDGEHEWEVLTDNGKGEFEDEEETLIPNDLLIIDAGRAFRLGISKGQARTIEDLAYELEFEDNYVLLDENEGQDILDDWAESIERSLDLISRERTRFGRIRGRLHRELEDIEVDGDWRERSAARGKMIGIYKRMISIFNRFEEVFDPNGGQRSQIRQRIDQIRLEQQDDPRPRRGSRRR